MNFSSSYWVNSVGQYAYLIAPLKMLAQILLVVSDVTQHVKILSSKEERFNWLSTSMVAFLSVGQVLVFATRKVDAEELAALLKRKDFDCVLLHGDMHQVILPAHWCISNKFAKFDKGNPNDINLRMRKVYLNFDLVKLPT